MPDECTILTEDEFDERYGDTINESPLHLTQENLEALIEYHIWTQAEDGGGQDWLINGVFGSDSHDFIAGRGEFNVIGYWLALKPWDGEPRSIRAKWGGDLEEEEGDDEEEEEET